MMQQKLFIKNRHIKATAIVMHNSVSLTLIGFGEVGKIFARDFLARGDGRVTAYDLKLDAPENADLIEKARAAGVTPAASAAEAARGADIVISAVTASSALDVARLAATYLKPGQIFFDINSASPGMKRSAAGTIESAGGRYVEAAVMTPISPKGIGSSMLMGGRHAQALRRRKSTQER